MSGTRNGRPPIEAGRPDRREAVSNPSTTDPTATPGGSSLSPDTLARIRVAAEDAAKRLGPLTPAQRAVIARIAQRHPLIPRPERRDPAA